MTENMFLFLYGEHVRFLLLAFLILSMGADLLSTFLAFKVGAREKMYVGSALRSLGGFPLMVAVKLGVIVYMLMYGMQVANLILLGLNLVMWGVVIHNFYIFIRGKNK